MHNQSVCPSCGYCPNCGRKNAAPYNPWAPYNPYVPINPSPWWHGGGGTITIKQQPDVYIGDPPGSVSHFSGTYSHPIDNTNTKTITY